MGISLSLGTFECGTCTKYMNALKDTRSLHSHISTYEVCPLRISESPASSTAIVEHL